MAHLGAIAAPSIGETGIFQQPRPASVIKNRLSPCQSFAIWAVNLGLSILT